MTITSDGYLKNMQKNYDFVLIADEQSLSGSVATKNMLEAAMKAFLTKMDDDQEIWNKYRIPDKYLNKIEPQLEFVEINIFNVLSLKIKKSGSRKKIPIEVSFWQYPTNPKLTRKDMRP